MASTSSAVPLREIQPPTKASLTGPSPGPVTSGAETKWGAMALGMTEIRSPGTPRRSRAQSRSPSFSITQWSATRRERRTSHSRRPPW